MESAAIDSGQRCEALKQKHPSPKPKQPKPIASTVIPKPSIVDQILQAEDLDSEDLKLKALEPSDPKS